MQPPAQSEGVFARPAMSKSALAQAALSQSRLFIWLPTVVLLPQHDSNFCAAVYSEGATYYAVNKTWNTTTTDLFSAPIFDFSDYVFSVSAGNTST